jgi:hypothetical protein
MKDLVNEGRNLQDNFKNKLVKENPIMHPSISAPSKLDAHYKINHPVLTLLSIQQSGGESKSMSSSQSIMIMTFGLKSSDTTMVNAESLMKDASKIARMICDLLDNYNTDHYPGRPSQKENTITIPIKVTTWTGD